MPATDHSQQHRGNVALQERRPSRARAESAYPHIPSCLEGLRNLRNRELVRHCATVIQNHMRQFEIHKRMRPSYHSSMFQHTRFAMHACIQCTCVSREATNLGSRRHTVTLCSKLSSILPFKGLMLQVPMAQRVLLIPCRLHSC